MKIASWNVNSIRARLERLLHWLAEHQPDVVCLQELKVTEEQFPFEVLREAGYRAAVYGQKAYNGVAILARAELTDVQRGFGDEEEEAQARLIAATVDGLRVLSAYVPNGAEVGSEKYAHKLRWLDRFKGYLKEYDLSGRPLVVCGDFNIAPEARDVAHPDAWEGTVLFNPEMRAAFRELLDSGLIDTFRKHEDRGGFYSWWDYRRLAFVRDDGLRIDHILATPPLADRCTAAWIDREARKGPKPSDHAPVIAVFDWP
ncbi:MAG: exodeoxyribonuclease III [Acidobacteria bacterium]|nr:MAG: exodeoxyribonuclease III [Acidobacteriota bacterium]